MHNKALQPTSGICHFVCKRTASKAPNTSGGWARRYMASAQKTPASEKQAPRI